MIYVGSVILFGGRIGNILNIIVFTFLKSFRGNQFGLYLISEPIFDCGQLLIAFTSRLVVAAFAYDPAVLSIFWCKLRVMLTVICSVMSVTLVCLSAFDQYLSTNPEPRIRRLSTLKLSHCLICISMIICMLWAIQFGIYFDIQPSAGCFVYNPILLSFVSFVHSITLLDFLPIVIASFFGSLAYRNVRRIIRRQLPIVRRRFDRQITAMILIRVCCMVIFNIWYPTYSTYTFFAPTNPNNYFKKSIDLLILTVTFLLFFTNYSI